MVRAWGRNELQKKNHLPRDLPLSYIREKVLSQSDMNASAIAPSCTPPTTYPGVSLSVYVSNVCASGQSHRLKLNKFHRCNSTGINGKGYMRFMVDCRLEAGDGVEVWDFWRPLGIHLCLLVAKNNDVRPARNT